MQPLQLSCTKGKTPGRVVHQQKAAYSHAAGPLRGPQLQRGSGRRTCNEGHAACAPHCSAQHEPGGSLGTGRSLVS